MSGEKNSFSIKDLENFSGIKAHTIRIWEKRYNILEPMRSNTNIRNYNLQNLQKLLNITLLHNHGYKISKIATFADKEIPELVKQIISDKNVKKHAVNAFKMAMINFDRNMFFETYDALLSEKSFKEIFHEVFIPLMNEVGMLWQTGTILPAHEHFISHLLRQKLICHIEELQIRTPIYSDKTFILYLPEDEVHDMLLLYLNYEVLLNGYNSVYLGGNIPLQDLLQVAQKFDNIVFVSTLTLFNQHDLNYYLNRINAELLKNNNAEIWFLGSAITKIEERNLSAKMQLFHTIKDFAKKL